MAHIYLSMSMLLSHLKPTHLSSYLPVSLSLSLSSVSLSCTHPSVYVSVNLSLLLFIVALVFYFVVCHYLI